MISKENWKPADKYGKYRVESKEDYKKKNNGKSPDYADALLLCYYIPKRKATPFIEVI